MITHAYISRYKSIAEIDVDFRDLNILVGPNGNGKSNLIDALYFLHDCVEEDLDTAIVKRHGIESIRQWSKTRPYHITIDVSVQNLHGTGRYKVVISSGRGAYKVIDEYGEWIGPDITSTEENRSDRKTTFRRHEDGTIVVDTHPESTLSSLSTNATVSSADLFLTVLGSPAFSMVSIFLRPLVEEFRAFIAYSIYPNTLREPRVVSRHEYLRPDGSNLSSILKLLNSGHKRNKDSLLSALQAAMPALTDITVKSAGGYYVPVITVRENSSEAHQFNMSQLSDGTLRVLGLLAAFYQPKAPNIIALEEPEQMIHPGLLPILTDAVDEFTSSREYRQVFITTHSPSLLDLVPPESIIWTNFSDGITTCGHLGERQMSIIKDHLFSAGEIMLSEGFTKE
jgi:predicted ATPase